MKIKATLELIKFSHSIFALPFALVSMVLAAPLRAAQGFPGWRLFFLILLAMVAARSSAMAFNRLIDAPIDAKNPRTQNRHLPKGWLSPRYVLFFTIASGFLFLLASYGINWTTFCLSPIALIIILGYSFTKRFTWLSHFWLGFSLGIAPIAVWIAIRNEISLISVWLCLAVTCWVAGFDIIYSTQDASFDRTHQLHSIPVRFGIEKGLNIARWSHRATLFFLFLFGWAAHLHPLYWPLLACIAFAFWWEHALVTPYDLSRVNAAFFTANGFVSLGFLLGMLIIVRFH